MKSIDSVVFDRAAITISVACVVQCMALPLTLLLLPALAVSPAVHAMFHIALLVVVLPLSAVAFAFGWRRHGSGGVLLLGGVGLLALLSAASLGHAVLGVAGETLLTAFGSGLLMVAHVLNIRRSRATSVTPV